MYQQTLRQMGPNHFKTRSTVRQLARIKTEEGQLEEAESMLNDTLNRDIQASDAIDALLSRVDLAEVEEKQNKYSEAESLLRQADHEAPHAYGAGNPDALAPKNELAENLLHQGKCDDALSVAQTLNAGWKTISSDNWRRFSAQSALGGALLCQKNYEAAKPLLTSAYNGLKAHAMHIPAYDQYELTRTAGRLAQLYSEQNKTAEAQKWREASAHP